MCKGISILGRILIGILSLVYAILGFALLILGILMKTNSDTILQYLNPLLEMVKQQAESSGSGGSISFEDFDINELVGSLSIIFIGLGVAMAVIGVLGIAGACCQVKCMLIMYMVIIIILLVGFIILIVIIAGDRTIITDPPKVGLKSAFHEDYAGIQGTNAVSLLWNVVMTGLQCCGIDGVSDIHDAPKWQKSDEQKYGNSPIACCKTGEFKDTTSACYQTPSDQNSNIYTPCYEKVWDFALKGIPFIIGACGMIGLMTLLVIFSCVILHEINKKNKVGPY